MGVKNNQSNIVLLCNTDNKDYNTEIPFNPPKNYIELSKFKFETDPKNLIYELVRDALIYLKLDIDNLGTPNWNPFSDFFNKGVQVLIKPNFVKDFHPQGIKGVISQITHASVLRPIINYTLLA